MTDEDGGHYCLPGYLKDRLMRSFESEKVFYQDKLDHVASDEDPRIVKEMENRVAEADEHLRTVEEMVICEELPVDDTDVPAEAPTPVPLDPLNQKEVALFHVQCFYI